MSSDQGHFIPYGKRIDETAVRPGGHIGIGHLTLVVQIDGHPQTAPQLHFAAQNLPRQDAPADEQFSEFSELEGLDGSLPNDLDSLDDELGELDSL